MLFAKLFDLEVRGELGDAGRLSLLISRNYAAIVIAETNDSPSAPIRAKYLFCAAIEAVRID